MSRSSSESETELSAAVTSYHTKYSTVETEVPGEGNQDESDDELMEAYSGEPLADDVWLREYNREREANERQMAEFQRRLEGSEQTNSWCRCGNCQTEYLKTATECSCCMEIDRCVVALEDKKVHEEVGKKLSCITNHPGFEPACLNRWTLEISASLYKTKERAIYKKTGSEERFFRGIAYRQFTRLVHGHLGDKRKPLPACAYNAIRSTFKVDDETFQGYSSDEQ